MSTRVAILGTRYPDFSIEEEVLGPLGAELVAAPGGDSADIIAAAADADVIIAGSRPRLDGVVLASLTRCRGIVRSGIGVDNVDVGAAEANGIAVANVPDYGTEAVAQHTLALALAALRRLREADSIVKEGRWGIDDLRPLHLPGSMTAGVVGFGRIGRRVAGLLLSIGFGRLLAHDPYTRPDGHGVEAVDLATLLSDCDLVCLHAPGSPDGSALMAAGELAAMKAESVLVNTSRGSLIDTGALISGLAAGRPRVAALDVYPAEPPEVGELAAAGDRLILSPHMAWYTEESQADLRRKSAEEAARLLRGEAPRHPVSTGSSR